MIAASPREQIGNPEDMWDRIVREMTAIDNSFLSLVGRNSIVSDFDSGELVVIVSPGKLRFAEDKASDIARIAKNLYGSDIYVTLRGGDIKKNQKAAPNASISEDETSRIINEDISVNEVIEDVENLFGLTPVVED
jgi:hypothetical protein